MKKKRFKKLGLKSSHLEGILLIALLLPALFSYFPLGYHFSMVNFTYGDAGLDPAKKAELAQAFTLIFLWAFFWEVALRLGLLRAALEHWEWKKALSYHLIPILALLILLEWPKISGYDEAKLLNFFAKELLLHCIWALYFLRTGSLILTSLFHASTNFIRHVVINDVQGPFDTLYFYSSASKDFDWLILSGGFLVLCVLFLLAEFKGLRVAPAHHDEPKKTA